eukprot:1161360-Pelagomonas_calceolata.AAC.10
MLLKAGSKARLSQIRSPTANQPMKLEDRFILGSANEAGGWVQLKMNTGQALRRRPFSKLNLFLINCLSCPSHRGSGNKYGME